MEDYSVDAYVINDFKDLFSEEKLSEIAQNFSLNNKNVNYVINEEDLIIQSREFYVYLKNY